MTICLFAYLLICLFAYLPALLADREPRFCERLEDEMTGDWERPGEDSDASARGTALGAGEEEEEEEDDDDFDDDTGEDLIVGEEGGEGEDGGDEGEETGVGGARGGAGGKGGREGALSAKEDRMPMQASMSLCVTSCHSHIVRRWSRKEVRKPWLTICSPNVLAKS
jgi:hypothetical protein